MNRLKKTVLKVLSYPYFNLKKCYKVYRKFLTLLHQPQKSMYHTFDYKIMVGGHSVPIRIFKPTENYTKKVLLFFHGGGWVTGNIDTYTNICIHMANETGYKVVSVDYRLAPENPFPAGLLDCYLVTKELFLHPELLHCKPRDITLIGDSAGGNLAAVVSLLARDSGEFLPYKQILLYPPTFNRHNEDSPFSSVKENGTDYFLTTKKMKDYMDMYISNKEDRNNPYVAPLLAENLKNQPKTLIITAEFDLLRDEGEAYGTRLKKAGNEVRIFRIKDALHGFLSAPVSNEPVTKTYQIINRFLNDIN